MFTYAFRCHGGPTIFGLGTPWDAARFLKRLNRDRAINEYRLEHANPGEADAIIFLGFELARSRSAANL
jgi:hypothetical protein